MMLTTHVLCCIRLSSALVTVGVSCYPSVSVLFRLTIDGWFVSADVEDHAAAEAGWKRRENLIIILRKSSGGSRALLRDWAKSVSSDLLDPHHVDERRWSACLRQVGGVEV